MADSWVLLPPLAGTVCLTVDVHASSIISLPGEVLERIALRLPPEDRKVPWAWSKAGSWAEGQVVAGSSSRAWAAALPAVLGRSEEEAGCLVRRLPEAERERLRAAALALARASRDMHPPLPAPAVRIILSTSCLP